MASIPAKVADRLSAGIKRFQPVLSSSKSRDVNESDTVIVVTDMLYYTFGYDKYSEITSEHAIRGTYCDLALKINEKLEILIEVKAIGLDLKDAFIKQAVDYAANQGVDWVVLTNGILWKIYKISFGKPIDQELVAEFDFLELHHKNKQHLECLYFISKEGWLKSAIKEYHEQKQALSRFYLSAIILSDPVVNSIKKELKKVSPDIKIQNEQIQSVLSSEVLKREVVEGEKADEAKRKITRTMNKFNKPKAEKKKTKKELKKEIRKEEVNQITNIVSTIPSE